METTATTHDKMSDNIKFTLDPLTDEQCIGYYYSRMERAIGINKARDPELTHVTLYMDPCDRPDFIFQSAVELFNRAHEYAKITRFHLGARFTSYFVEYNDCANKKLCEFVDSYINELFAGGNL